MIDEPALAFLLCRGVIPRDLFFRIRKAAAAAGPPPPSLAVAAAAAARGGGKAPMRLLPGREVLSRVAYDHTETRHVHLRSCASDAFPLAHG